MCFWEIRVLDGFSYSKQINGRSYIKDYLHIQHSTFERFKKKKQRTIAGNEKRSEKDSQNIKIKKKI